MAACDSAPNPLDPHGKRLVMLYQVDAAGYSYNDWTAAGLDLSDCNPEISHTLNNEPKGVIQLPGKDGLGIDYAKMVADDVIVLTFDIPMHSFQIYQSMYSYAKYGILDEGKTPYARYLDSENTASPVTEGRYFRLFFGYQNEDMMRTVSTGPNTQHVEIGYLLYPKSITWDWKPGRVDYITVRFTGTVTEMTKKPNDLEKDEDTWFTTLLKIILSISGGVITGLPAVGWFLWPEISEWLDGDSQYPGGPLVGDPPS